jgi:hypothetical protein
MTLAYGTVTGRLNEIGCCAGKVAWHYQVMIDEDPPFYRQAVMTIVIHPTSSWAIGNIGGMGAESLIVLSIGEDDSSLQLWSTLSTGLILRSCHQQ